MALTSVLAFAIAVVIIVTAWPCASARADGDPASDALIAQNVFYPYSVTVSPGDQNMLNAEVAAAHRAGVDLKVALIAQVGDLGSVTGVFGKPQAYARFLDVEISYERKVPLLVVMPDGFGVEGLSATAQRRIMSSPAPRGGSGADLAAAATQAISRALSGAGKISSGSSHGGGSGRVILLLVLILAAVLVAGALVVMRVFFPPEEA